jgi:hypothetical protein
MNNKKSAFSTLEALMALAVIAIGLSCALLVVLGSQALVESSQLGGQALQDARDLTESGEINESFPGLRAVINFQDEDAYTRQVTGAASWQITGRPKATIGLDSLWVDWQDALAANGCQISPSGLAQSAIASMDFSYGQVAAIHARGQELFVGLSATAAKTQPTFLVFSLASTTNPTLEGSLDNATTTTAGISAIDVAGNYAYAASARAISASAGFGQLQIIDVSQPQTPRLTVTYKIPGVAGTSGQGIGSSIFYSGGFVYLGLTKTGSGPEFNVVDVHDVMHPEWVGGFSFGSTVNAIVVKWPYAYVAHPVGSGNAPQEQLTILDVSNPANILRVAGFRANDSQGNGKSLFLQGNNLYFGRTVTNTGNPEFAVFDVSSVSPATPTPLASLKISSSVNSLMAWGPTLLALTNSQLLMFDVSGLPSLPELSPALPLPPGAAGGALACSGGTVYAAGASASSGFLLLIAAGGN